MARRYYKKYYKRKYKAKKKALTKRNIFTRKGARSQAYQINALNNKIDRIYKMTAPKIQTWQTYQLSAMNFDFRGDNTNFFTGYTLQGALISRAMATGSSEQHFKWNGSLLRVRNIDLRLIFKAVMSESVLDEAIESKYNNLVIGPGEKNVIGRITILKLKNSVNSINSQTYIHRVFQTEGVNYKCFDIDDTVQGPLSKDITSYGKVIYDKKFRIGSFNNNYASMKSIRIRLPGGTYRKPESFKANDILGKDYYICITAGFEGVGSTERQFCNVGDYLSLDTHCKIAYVNDEVAETQNRLTELELKKGPDFLGKEEGLNTEEEE